MRTDLPNDKKTKAELLEIVEEQVHLASAVEAKDKEILLLKEEIKAIKTKAKDEVEAIKTKTQTEVETIKTKSQTEHDDVIKRTEEEKEKNYHELKNEYEGQINSLKESLSNLNLKLQQAEERRIIDLNSVLTVHGDLLKSMEALTNTHLNMNKLVVKELGGN